MVISAVIERLRDHLYQSAIRPNLWEYLPNHLAEAAGGGAWALQLVRPGAPRRVEIHGFNFDPTLLRQYPERFAQNNLWLNDVLQAPILQLVDNAGMVDQSCFLESLYYSEFLYPQGDLRHSLGMGLSRSFAGQLVVSCNFAPDQMSDVGPAAGEILSQLGPDLQRAVQLTRQAERAAMATGIRLAAGMDRQQACYVLDARSRPVAINPRGREIVARDAVLGLKAERLRFDDESANAALDEALAGTMRAVFPIGHDGPHRLLARLTPVTEPGLIAPIEAFLHGEKAVATLQLVGSGSPEAVEDDLHLLFELTPAETFVLRRLCEGLSMAEIAELRGASTNTVRNQLRSLFDKTGTSRQAELVALVARLGA